MDKTSWIPGILLFTFIAGISGFHGFLLHSFASLILLCVLLITAYPFSRFLFGRTINAVIFTFPIGYVIHAVFLSFAGFFFGINVTTFLGYLVCSLLISILLFPRMSASEVPSDGWTGAEILILWCWLLLAVLLVALPFLKVGWPTSEGFAYRAYFNTDFFRHMAVSANLSHHGIPPDNPYFSGEVLHYYWFFHIIPAFWLDLVPSYSLDYLMVQFHLVIGCMFVASLYAAVRHFTTHLRTRILLLPIFLFGGSYEGIYVLYMLKQKGMAWHSFTDWNIDAILRWFWSAPQVDTLYRALLYTPQHLIGLAIFLVVLLCWSAANSFLKRLFLFALLFAIAGFTVIIAAALILGFGILLLLEAIRDRRKKLITLVVCGVSGLVFLAVYVFVFKMFGTQGGELKFGVNHQVLKHLPGYLLLNWGAILILGLAGLVRWSPKLPLRVLSFYLLLCASFVLLLNVDVPGLSEITLKMGFLSYVVLLLLASGFLDRIARLRPVHLVLILLLILPGFVTWTMDFYNNQDITNKKFTSDINPDDEGLYEWMSKNLEGTATVQNYSLAGEGFLSDYVTEIPALGQRAVFLGDKIHSRLYQITQKEIDRRERIVWKLFHLTSSGQISITSQRAGIEYLILLSKDTSRTFEAHLGEPYFTLSKRVGNSRIYRVNPREVGIAEMEVHVLLQNAAGDFLLQVRPVRNFYEPELRTGLETSRWMSNDALLVFDAKQPLRGVLSFIAYAYQADRKMVLSLNGKPGVEKAIIPRGTKVSIPVELKPGENQLIIHGAEEPSVSADGKRLLTFRIWNLQFKPDDSKRPTKQ